MISLHWECALTAAHCVSLLSFWALVQIPTLFSEWRKKGEMRKNKKKKENRISRSLCCYSVITFKFSKVA
jgi:hypothetical protein